MPRTAQILPFAIALASAAGVFLWLAPWHVGQTPRGQPLSASTLARKVCLNNLDLIHQAGTKLGLVHMALVPEPIGRLQVPYQQFSPVGCVEPEYKVVKTHWVLERHFGLAHIHYQMERPPTGCLYFKDSLLLGSAKHAILDIIALNGYDTAGLDMKMTNFVSGAYQFSFVDRSYLLIIVEDINNSGIHYFQWPLLYRLDSLKAPPLVIGRGTTRQGISTGSMWRLPPDYLGDFDGDGQLDFLDFNGGDTSHVYSLRGNRFEKRPGQYLIMAKGVKRYEYYVDLDHSSWFHRIDSLTKPDTLPCELPLIFPDSMYIYRD
jgi:hypothetical protein